MKPPIALSALALAGCAPIQPVMAGPTAALGQVAQTNGLKVRPTMVIEDSRCPTNVHCVWAGRLIVRAEVSGGRWRAVRALELGKPIQIADGRLTLIAAEPAVKEGVRIDPRAYRFTFDFQGGL